MKQYTIIFSEEEKNALIQLIDGAVRAGGLQVAENGAVLARKILVTQPEEVVEEPKQWEEVKKDSLPKK